MMQEILCCHCPLVSDAKKNQKINDNGKWTQKTTMERERKLTFKVLTSTHSASSWLTPPLSTLLKVLPSSGSWRCGNSKPSKLNFNARSQVNPKPKRSSCPCFSSTGDGGEWKRREWRKKMQEGGRWVGGRKGRR